MAKYVTPRGTHDILPGDWRYWNYVHRHAEDAARLYGYRRIETPTFGEASLFTRTTGADTDTGKEMYVFQDRDGAEMALRPEGTAPVVRAYLQHGMSRLSRPVKMYYLERVYRYDRPQRGRYREHHQFGCEALGVESAQVDVELISLLRLFYQRLGLRDLVLHINTIGDPICRPAYIETLVAYLREHNTELADIDRERVTRNPLRVLDSKERESQRVIEGAPRVDRFLCSACAAHWSELRSGLDDLKIRYTANHRLVRGLDYYTRTVFEFIPNQGGGQTTVGAGGRYDGLAEAIGGPHVPGVGFGTGLERVVLNLQEQNVPVVDDAGLDIFIAYIGIEAKTVAMRCADAVRRDGSSAVTAFGERSVKAQLKQADAMGARFVVVLGDDELQTGTAAVREMSGTAQEDVQLANLAAYISARSS